MELLFLHRRRDSRPEKNLPISLFLGAAFVSLCYCLINYIFLYTVPMGELAGQIDVGYLSAKSIFGQRGGAVMTVLVCLALISSLSSLIMVGPRVTQTMSEDMQQAESLGDTECQGRSGLCHYSASRGGDFSYPDRDI